eukprot:m.117781 g.117781  ORF g.117781 m.117781 type:complete len:221 (+) comp14260_c0_seq1:102-764(+)
MADNTNIPDTKFVEAISGYLSTVPKAELDNLKTSEVDQHLRNVLSLTPKEIKANRTRIDAILFRAYGQLTPPSEVSEGLFLGDEWNATNLPELKKLNCRYVLNCTKEDTWGGVASPFVDDVKYMRIEEIDDETGTLLPYFEAASKFISDAFRDGSHVLVHCQRGISRSATIVIAHLMKEKGWTLQEALESVKAKRKQIKPNEKFLTELKTFEASLDKNKT